MNRILLAIRVDTSYILGKKKNNPFLPTRGSVNALSDAITHKREIISLYLESYLTQPLQPKHITARKLLIVILKIIIEWKCSACTVSLNIIILFIIHIYRPGLSAIHRYAAAENLV